MPSEFLKLMIPGPIQPSSDVLAALGEPAQAHYGAAWTKFYNETLDLLRKVFDTRGSVFLMTGSGTVGIDACLGSALSTGEKIIIGTNGFFGDRVITVAKGYGLDVIPVKGEWGKPLRPEAIEAALAEHPDARMVAAVHLETSTTIVNPIEIIGDICRDHDALFMVDAVSSLGGLPIKTDAWGIDLIASASQKCLGSIPGLAPIAVSQHAWEAIDRNPQKNHGWYSDLRTWRWYATEWGDWHPTPITMASNLVCALRTSLEALMAEGIDTRLERYCGLAMRLREGLRRIGWRLYTPDELLAPVLTAAYVPDGVQSSRVVDYMAEVHHTKISTGLGDLKEKLIRIGHMSPTVSEADIDEVVEALAEFRA